MASKTGRELQARIERTRDGLYLAEYHGEVDPGDRDAPEIPDSHLGTDEHEVKTWVEQMAKGMGYERVVWRTAD